MSFQGFHLTVQSKPLMNFCNQKVSKPMSTSSGSWMRRHPKPGSSALSPVVRAVISLQSNLSYGSMRQMIRDRWWNEIVLSVTWKDTAPAATRQTLTQSKTNDRNHAKHETRACHLCGEEGHLSEQEAVQKWAQRRIGEVVPVPYISDALR